MNRNRRNLGPLEGNGNRKNNLSNFLTLHKECINDSLHVDSEMSISKRHRAAASVSHTTPNNNDKELLI
jgi:hypothetical protein